MIIMLGVAGSGKSTQSQLLASYGDYTWLSMGEILRRSITDARRDDMLAGKVLNEADVIAILAPILHQHGNTSKVILDGFPRGLKQAEWLLAQRKAGNIVIQAVVHLQAHKSAVKARLLARGRQDDTETAIAARFYEYEHTVKPIIASMESSGVPIIDINAEQAANEVSIEIIDGLKSVGIIV